ncbi:MAG: AAA family ATPase, partial [Bacillota bacterium]
ALLRPGRIDRIVRLGLPGPQARAALIAKRLAGRPVAADVRPDHLARPAEGMSPAEIVAAVDRAVSLAQQEGREVSQGDLERELRRGSGMPAGRPRSLLDIWRDVEGLVGLAPVKAFLREVAAAVEVSRRRLAEGLPPLVQSLHMCFQGNPGTGKTTVARLAGELLAALGALPGGHLVVCRGGDLVDAEAVRAATQRALGGVLFVDEAHSIPNRGALSELVSIMESHRDRLCVILAGYAEAVMALFRADPGLESRVAFVCRFPDYTPEECLEIVRREAGRLAYRLSPVAEEALLARFRSVDLGAVGNGRYARRLVEAAIRKHAVRVAEGGGADLTLLEACDFEGVE